MMVLISLLRKNVPNLAFERDWLRQPLNLTLGPIMRTARLQALVMLIFGVSGGAIAEDNSTLHCGSAEVGVFNSAIKGSPFFVLKVQAPTGWKYYPFLMTRDYFEMRCETRANGRKAILLNHFCGGSGCAESNYGIVDAETGKQLLEPEEGYRGNYDRASRILGHPVKSFSCKTHSSTSLGEMGAEGEYCFRSPQELG